MAIVIVQDPLYPIADEEVTLSITGGQGTRVDWELTSVPPESELETGKLFDVAGDPTDVFVPDVPGEYGFTAYDIRETGVAPPRWRDDPIATPGTVLIATQTGTVHVAAVVSLPITTAAGHGARLELRIVDDTVRGAELLEPLTELSRTAILDEDVVDALADLEGELVTEVGNDFVSGVADLREKFEAHREDTDFAHFAVDDINTILNYPPNSVQPAILVLNETYDKLVSGHMQSGATLEEADRWHTVGDGVNAPLAGKATTLAQGTVTFADLAYRVYERHRVLVDDDVHDAADVANALTAPAAPLTLLIVALFDVIADTSPADVTGESQGAIEAAHLYGFV